MAVFKCKMCGAALEIEQNKTVIECDYCNTKQTLPKLNDDKKANLYDRANHLRRNNEFDKAMRIYEQILDEDRTDAEAYWSLVLCHYGIEYVEDPKSYKRIPTINRAQFTSIFDDANYKSALEYADVLQRDVFEAEAKAINTIQKGYLAISQNEEPYDVFICYKETDENGKRTQDSVIANRLYHCLKEEGFKAFYAPITLEDKLGISYEPYIFAALNSAKVMVVMGTCPEYFNAVWVKNEWSRYLALIKQGQQKMLIPAYKEMNPYDLPEEFSHLQALNMGDFGFMQDLTRGIKKIIGEKDTRKIVEKIIVEKTTGVAESSGNASIPAYLKRVELFLEDCNWESADEYCEKVLDIDPENAQAYLGKLMADLKVRSKRNLSTCEPFEYNNNYIKAVRFADSELLSELKKYVTLNKTNQVYSWAHQAMQTAKTSAEYIKIAERFKSIIGYLDAELKAEQCLKKVEELKIAEKMVGQRAEEERLRRIEEEARRAQLLAEEEVRRRERERVAKVEAARKKERTRVS